MFYDLSVLLSRDRYRPIYTVSIWMLVYTSAVIPLHPTSRATFEPAIEPWLDHWPPWAYETNGQMAEFSRYLG